MGTLKRGWGTGIPLQTKGEQEVGAGVGGLSDSVKKGNFVTKIFLTGVEWSSKILWKMISADVKANKNK